MSPATVRHPSPRAGSFVADAAQGAWRQGGGERLAMFSLPSLLAVHATLVDQFGDHAADLLYRIGYEVGLQRMVALSQDLRTQGRTAEVWQLPAQEIFDSWWTPLRDAGWGLATLTAIPNGRGLALVTLESSVVVAALGSSEEPVCHLYAGMFAGAFSFLDRTERHGAELECRATGAAQCRFAIGSGADIDAAEAWRQQGTPATEIVRRLG